MNSFLCYRITARHVGRIYANGRKEQKEKAEPRAKANARPEVEHISPEVHQMILIRHVRLRRNITGYFREL